MYKTLFTIKKLFKKKECHKNQFGNFYNGHYYSPIPSAADIKERFENFDCSIESIKDINLNVEAQLNNLKEFQNFLKEDPFKTEKCENLNYFYSNESFDRIDGYTLYSMIRKLQPKKIIEVGSGYSTALMVDVNKLFFNNSLEITCIEPYPQRLKMALRGNMKHIKLNEKKLQEIDLKLFEQLEENDILFLDSTHVSKLNSDVNKIFFEILPRLKKGVFIHFHDVFFPFEYSKNWAEDGIAWNESYILRAFLMNNENYEIQLFNSFLGLFYREEIKTIAPYSGQYAGGSIWLKKV